MRGSTNKKWNILTAKTEALYRDGLKGTPFNIIIATFLMIILLQEPMLPANRVWIWWIIMGGLTFLRWGLIYWGIRQEIWKKNEKLGFVLFSMPTFIIGLTWGLGYVAFVPFLTPMDKTFYIILTFGGMASGALSSLAASYICYYLYLFPMAIPLISYHSLVMGIAGLSISAIFTGYIIFLMIIHRESHNLLMKNITLTHRQENLLHQIESTNQQLRVANDHLKSISLIDGLTKVANRHYFKEIIKRDWEQTRQTGECIAILIVDLDYFKEFNDCYGHLKGDECLQTIADILKKNIKRKTDLVARYGGDEFIVILNHTPIEGALSIAKTILKDIEDAKIKHEKSKISKYVTVSIGAAAVTPNKEESFEGLISDADKALYKAKQGGRNMVTAYAYSPQIH